MADLPMMPAPDPTGAMVSGMGGMEGGMGAPATPSTKPKATPEEIQKSLNPLPMTAEELSEWWARIAASEERTKAREGQWDVLMQEYTPKVNSRAVAEDVKTNIHFRNIHTKMGQLFVLAPDVRMTPKGPALDTATIANPQTGMPQKVSPADAVPIRQAVINYYMGPEEIDGVRLMDECLLDMQGYSGLAAVKVGYRAISRSVDKPVMGPDPTFVPPPVPQGILGLAPTPQAPMVPQMDLTTGQPKVETIQVPIFEEWFGSKFSTKKLLLDEQLVQPNIEKYSRWIGMKFYINKRLAQRQYGLTDVEVAAAAASDDRVFIDPTSGRPADGVKDLLAAYEITYRACYFTDEDHPQRLHQLVLFEGIRSRTFVHRPSLDQTFDEEGKLTYDSVTGFPIKVGSLRDAIDTPFVQADSAFTNAMVRQLDVFNQQLMKLRDAAIGKYFYDTGAIDAQDLEKLKSGEVGAYIGLKDGALAQGAEKLFYTSAQVKQNPDDWRTIQMLKQQIDETLGISAVQAGSNPDTVRSATEISEVGAGAAGRQRKEQARVIGFYLSIVRMVDTLIFRYATGNRYIQVVGSGGAKKLEVWNKKLGAGCYAYDIRPDSQLAIDAARDRQQKIAAYTVMSPDPLYNRAPILRDIARDFGQDPTEVVKDPEAASMELAARQAGAPAGQPPHDGAPNKHVMEQSGSTPNAPGQAATGDNREDRNP